MELASAVPSIVGVVVVWYWEFVLITGFSGAIELSNVYESVSPILPARL